MSVATSFRTPSKVARRLRMTPRAIGAMKSWAWFMYHYALGLVPQRPYRFRSGARLQIGRGVDHAPIVEIFLDKDYGDVRDDTVVVDLGASIGTFAVYAATSAHNVRVFAYEPMPAFYKLLRLNVALNGLEHSVQPFNLAVAADRSDRQLSVGAPGLLFPTLMTPAQHASVSTPVHCVDLATIVGENGLSRVDLLKMDIEGAEYDVLEAAPRELFRHIREIRMEYHVLDDLRQNVAGLKAMLTARGYRITRERAQTPTNGTIWASQHD